MSYPKQVVLIINHSKDDIQTKRITFQTLEEHRDYIKNLASNQQLIEEDDREEEQNLLSPYRLMCKVFNDIGSSYKEKL